jgi:D-cysteine desulfhydrase
MTRTAPLIFGELPDLARAVPWLPLAEVPTAVESCDALRPWLGRGGVFMKRDDLVSPLYGGNKVRRYEFVLADAKARGASHIVTVGGLASTQVMATALFGRQLGFRVSAILFDQPVTDFAREQVRGFCGSGARIVYGGGYVRTITRTWSTLREDRASNYFIMPGAAEPLANIGYIDAMMELAEQVARGEMPRPDLIVLPTGSSGTLAALALGAARLGWQTQIVGVRITTPLACNRITVDAIIFATDHFLAHRDRRWTESRRRVNYTLYGRELGPGYGHPTEAARAGAERLADLTGSPGEVTYSGKALAALRTLCAMPEHRKKTILLWNTLSTPKPRDLVAPSEVPSAFRWMWNEEPSA